MLFQRIRIFHNLVSRTWIIVFLVFLNGCGSSSSSAPQTAGDENQNTPSGDIGDMTDGAGTPPVGEEDTSSPDEDTPQGDVVTSPVDEIDPETCVEIVESVSVAESFVFGNFDGACDYLVTGKLRFGEQVTIEAGAVILMSPEAGLEFTGSSDLIAVGTMEQPIRILGSEPGMSAWDRVRFFGDRIDLQHVTLSGASAGFTVQANDAILDHVNVTLSGGIGLTLLTSDSRLTGDRLTSFVFQNNRFEGNNGYGLQASEQYLRFLDGTSSYDNPELSNADPGVRITLYSANIDTIVPGDLGIPIILPALFGNVSIEAGAEIWFERLRNSNQYFSVTSFTAIGTAENNITLRNMPGQDEPWPAIDLALASGDNVVNKVDYAVFDGGGAKTLIGQLADSGTFVFRNGNLEISNSVIKNSASWGISCASFTSTPPQLTGVTFENNASGDIDPRCPE